MAQIVPECCHQHKHVLPIGQLKIMLELALVEEQKQ